LTSSVKFRKPVKPLGVQEMFWDITMRVGKSQVSPASQEGKRNAQGWLFRAAGPVGTIRDGADPAGRQPQYALAVFRLERAEVLHRVIGCRRVADRLGGFVLRLKKLRAAGWGVA
jgi:hypothetical protein